MCLGCCSIGRVNGSSSPQTLVKKTQDEKRAALLSDSNKTGSSLTAEWVL